MRKDLEKPLDPHGLNNPGSKGNILLLQPCQVLKEATAGVLSKGPSLRKRLRA